MEIESSRWLTQNWLETQLDAFVVHLFWRKTRNKSIYWHWFNWWSMVKDVQVERNKEDIKICWIQAWDPWWSLFVPKNTWIGMAANAWTSTGYKDCRKQGWNPWWSLIWQALDTNHVHWILLLVIRIQNVCTQHKEDQVPDFENCYALKKLFWLSLSFSLEK